MRGVRCGQPTYTRATDDESTARFRQPRHEGAHDERYSDEIKGRTKEAVGVLTDDKELQREGKTDQAAAASKNKLDNATDWGKDKIDDIKNKLNEHD
jgi:uncharacterized protein YjbJ (UPF0337 family)